MSLLHSTLLSVIISSPIPIYYWVVICYHVFLCLISYWTVICHHLFSYPNFLFDCYLSQSILIFIFPAGLLSVVIPSHDPSSYWVIICHHLFYYPHLLLGCFLSSSILMFLFLTWLWSDIISSLVPISHLLLPVFSNHLFSVPIFYLTADCHCVLSCPF